MPRRAGEDRTGYKVILGLARRSNHTFDMKEGTLYPVLHGLEQQGYVEAYRQEAPTGRMRKYYHLTKRAARPCGRRRRAGGGTPAR